MLDPNLLFEACADETRRRILVLLLTRGELCVCDLFSVLGVPQPKVSRHLAVLREAGVLVSRKRGTWVHYRLNPEMPLWAGQVLSGLADGVAQVEPYCSDTGRLQSDSGAGGACAVPVLKYAKKQM
jgi:ArsR family transcriptional regulator